MTKYIVLNLVLLAHTFVYSQNETLKNVKIIAHRGASFYAPENTVASVKLGWQHHADAVEIDIHLSADKKIMVIHDYNTMRTTGTNFKIAETSSENLRVLDAGSWKGEAYKGEKIPFLKEILEIIPAGKKLIIEIKSNKEIVPYLKHEIEFSGKMSQCEIISFDFEALVAAKEALPKIPVYYLINKLMPETLNEVLNKLANNKIDGLNLNFSSISPELAALCSKNHIPLYSWTIDDAEMAKMLVSLGVTGITTNKPLEIRKGLMEK